MVVSVRFLFTGFRLNSVVLFPTFAVVWPLQPCSVPIFPKVFFNFSAFF